MQGPLTAPSSIHISFLLQQPEIAYIVLGFIFVFDLFWTLRKGFVCVEVLRPSQPNGVMSSAVSLPNHMFTGQA